MTVVVGSAQANLVVNGTFDVEVPSNGTGGGWTSDDILTGGGWCSACGPGPSGSYFILNSDFSLASDPSLEQTLTGLLPGATYDITGDSCGYHGSGNPSALSSGVEVDGVLLLETQYPGRWSDGWCPFAARFEATASAHVLRLTGERNGDDTSYAIDNIAVVSTVDANADGWTETEDCDDLDSAINPLAVELPGNFVDENCDGSLGDCDRCFPWRNHGEYMRCVAHGVEVLVESGSITEEEGYEMVSSAARSNIGKNNYIAPECQ